MMPDSGRYSTYRAVRVLGATSELEQENARLKKLLAESLLENEITREALRKKCDR